ncbi:hypothetical protein QTG54_015750 [Skeletonema marinoi]|uniref:Integrase catalytic domain-containing protein n=1 Tax=Skeletonema marinoi TaxID=267567 RepID=A0AAD8XTS4_9STRA|nr:hypothetical protein QTG54_015750 [Skeletonema marinoi]
MKVVESGITERHRHTFNARVFPDLYHDGKLKDLKDHPSTKVLSVEMSQQEWEEAINIVLHFGPKLQRDATDEQMAFRNSLDTAKARKWSSLVELFRVEEYTLPGSDIKRKRLLRLHERAGWSEGKWLLCIPQLEVFDAISENHGIVSHMKQNQTCVKVHEKYYNITETQVNIFVQSCETCNHARPVVKRLKGAKKPILSENFRDRFQVDLIDMRSVAMDDVYDNTMRWILTLKDHSTQLTYLVPLPKKMAKFVAYELDRIFGLIGYPSIFHTDNGKEFTANQILELLKEYSESIITVTGRPRTPSDQGSVESMNKLVERIIQDLENDERLKGREPNWTRLLGRAMQTINSKCGRGKFDCEPYKAVFGQSYHQQISCSISDMRKCTTIDERLKLSADDRLKNVAEELCVMGKEKSLAPPTNPYWEDDNSSTLPPIESEAPCNPTEETITRVDPNAAADTPTPLITGSEDTHTVDKNISTVEDAIEAEGQDDATGSEGTHTVEKNIRTVEDAIEAKGQDDEMSDTNVATSEVQTGLERNLSSRSITAESDTALVNKASSTRQKYSVSQGKQENKTRTRKLVTPRLTKMKNKTTVMRSRLTSYEFIYPTLECDCCLLGNSLISVGDETYLRDCTTTNRWYESDFLSSFGALVAHRYHSYGQNGITLQFITCSYPNETVDVSQCSTLASTTQRVVSVFHGDDHYVVADIDVSKRVCTISDGLKFSLRTWTKHIMNVLKRCKLMDLDSVGCFDDSTSILEVDRIVPEKWIVTFDKNLVTQHDSFNCGPIACLKLHEIFLDKETFNDIDTANYRSFVTSRFQTLVRQLNDDLVVSFPVRSDIRDRTTHTKITKIECFCLEETAPEELTIKLKCCNKRQHASCAYKWLDTSGTCGLCRRDVKQIEFQGSVIPIGVIGGEATSHNDSHFTSDANKNSPPLKKDVLKSSTLSDEVEVTPLRQADSVRKIAASSKRKRQEKQAEKMIQYRNQQDATGVGIGAVVTVSCDKRDVSHSTGIRAVVFRVKEGTGGILACSEHGIIHQSNKKDYWIPSDRYCVTSSPDANAVLTDGLTSIRDEVLGNTFDPLRQSKVTLQQAHKLLTGNSPRRRAACRCQGGRCGGNCGCRKKKIPCSSNN